MSEYKMSDNYNFSDYLVPHGTVNGVAVAIYTTPEFRHKVETKFKLRPESDIFIVTYPKSGTTWMQAIVREMLLKDDPEDLAAMKLTNRLPWTDSPHEMVLDAVESWPSPRVFKCHHHSPEEMDSLFFKGNRKMKIIYVTRDPRDIAVSLYHHIKKMKFSAFVNESAFDTFQKTYMRDKDVVFYGLWEAHVENWLNARKEYDILVVKYEDMIEDAVREIKRVAAFLEVDLSETSAQDIAVKTSFKSATDNMHNLFNDDTGMTNSLLRKGVAGDWVNNFEDEEEAERMGKIAEELYWKHEI